MSVDESDSETKTEIIAWEELDARAEANNDPELTEDIKWWAQNVRKVRMKMLPREYNSRRRGDLRIIQGPRGKQMREIFAAKAQLP